MYNPLSQTSASDAAPVTLRLSCLPLPTPVYPQTRSLVLPSDGRPVYVKRASRNGNKLAPSPYNAYFDCQVMSRNHAELSCVKNGPVMIKDTSRHGTFINENKIGFNKLVELRSGDSLRFGDSVTKSSGQTWIDASFWPWLTHGAAAPEAKVEGIMSTVTFDKKKHTLALADVQVRHLSPRRGWNVTMPMSDDEVTPEDDEHDTDDKLRNSGLSSQDPIDLDDEDTQSDGENARQAAQSEVDHEVEKHKSEQSFDLDFDDDEAELGSIFGANLADEVKYNEDYSSDFDPDYEDESLDKPLSDLDEDDDDKSNSDLDEDVDEDDDVVDDSEDGTTGLTRISPANQTVSSNDLNEPSSELGSPSSSLRDGSFSGLTQKDNSAVPSQVAVKSPIKAFDLSSCFPLFGKQAQDVATAIPTLPVAVAPSVTPLPPIRAAASVSSAPICDMLAPLPELPSHQNAGKSVRVLEDILNPEPQKSAPVFYKPVHEQVAIDAQPHSTQAQYWTQYAPTCGPAMMHTPLFDIFGQGDRFRNKYSDSFYGVQPQAHIRASDAGDVHVVDEAVVGAQNSMSQPGDSMKDSTKDSTTHTADNADNADKDGSHEQSTPATLEGDRAEDVNDDTNGVEISEPREADIPSNTTPEGPAKEQTKGLKRKRTDADSTSLESESLDPFYLLQTTSPVKFDVRSMNRKMDRKPRSIKRARSSSTSLALTAVAGAVGGAMATLTFLWGPLGERLLESAV